MRYQIAITGSALLFVAGCALPQDNVGKDAKTIGAVPDKVLAMAGPDQDLSTVHLRPEDGCYWYEHSGPVETTVVPLRTASGSLICLAQES